MADKPCMCVVNHPHYLCTCCWAQPGEVCYHDPKTGKWNRNIPKERQCGAIPPLGTRWITMTGTVVNPIENSGLSLVPCTLPQGHGGKFHERFFTSAIRAFVTTRWPVKNPQETKFKAGDIVILTQRGKSRYAFAAEISARATVQNPAYLGVWLQITWDRSTNTHSQADGGYDEKDFDLLMPAEKNPVLNPPKPSAAGALAGRHFGNKPGDSLPCEAGTLQTQILSNISKENYPKLEVTKKNERSEYGIQLHDLPNPRKPDLSGWANDYDLLPDADEPTK